MEELWGDVSGGSTPKVELLSWVLDDSRQAKVCNLQVPVVILGGKKEILWLEVAVNNTVSVKIFEGGEKVAHDRSCVRLPVQALALDLLEELTALEEGQQQVDILGRLISLVKLQNIVVRDGPKHINFSENRLLEQKEKVRMRIRDYGKLTMLRLLR